VRAEAKAGERVVVCLQIAQAVVEAYKSALYNTSKLPLHCRQRHRTAGLEGSWAAICVIGEKSKPRETASGGAP